VEVPKLERSWTTELAQHVGADVVLRGWLHHQRQLAQVTFLLLRDARGIAQVVVEDDAARQAVGGLLPETVVEVRGRVDAVAQAPGGMELHDPTVSVITAPAEAPPFELRRKELNAQLPTVLDHAAVALRHPRHRAMFAISAAAMAGFRAALDELGFTEIQTPKVVGSATESGANVFVLDYFGRPAYLAQSPQFYKQTMVGVFERVYETGPVFRAEPHDTARHLAEYVSLDAEFGFINDHRDVMKVLRAALSGMNQSVATRAGAALDLLGITLPVVPDEIPAIHFTDAMQMLGADEPDLSPVHERTLGEWAQREHGSDFLFVEGYPMSKRPFYTHPDRQRPGSSNSFDLIFRGVELVTGGQRLHRYEDYLDVLGPETAGVLDGYLEAFRHGMPPHGGFAIGLERWVARVVGAANVREATLFPRDLHRLSP
jgi:nondiscriminating aspartyl-tRNA synthetase